MPSPFGHLHGADVFPQWGGIIVARCLIDRGVEITIQDRRHMRAVIPVRLDIGVQVGQGRVGTPFGRVMLKHVAIPDLVEAVRFTISKPIGDRAEALLELVLYAVPDLAEAVAESVKAFLSIGETFHGKSMSYERAWAIQHKTTRGHCNSA